MTHIDERLMAAVLVFGALGGACRAEETSTIADAESVVTEQSPIVEGTPQAYGVLDLLNDAATTFEMLDDVVRLDRRAAENLIAHRDGADGVYGTNDDDAFEDIAEVDAVPYVGPAALDRLLAFAEAEGYVASGGDLLGVFDNVAFTVDEADATLALVNDAPYEQLDDEIGLDARAVDSIMAARTIDSLLELSGLYYVGQSAMLKLRDYPKTAGGTTGLGDECDAHAECESGLCAGLLAPNGYGICVEAWMADDFASTTDVPIADNGVTEDTIVVDGLASVPMDVLIDLDIEHPRKQDLVVILHQPNGPEALLWNHEANPPTHFSYPEGIEGDNMVNGDWVLEIRDTVTGESGTLRGWSMWLSSRYD